MITKCAIFVYLITTPIDGVPVLRSGPMDCDDAQRGASVENKIFSGTRSIARTIPLYRWWEQK